MTTITKLSLQGVRSYSDAAPEAIEFFRPLTIILGNNGSGKTTIIEALKYITTGTLPPVSDQGKSFVHDPKLSSHPTVKAQIRLLFRIENDSKAVLAMRSFQLTQSRTARQFKALEGVLKIKQLSDGSEKSISQKCADMDKLVPQLMGVNPSILENVIFCHQSESDWPLSDSKSLKLKFDDIFSATRYTKALESIIKLKNEKRNSIKLMEAELKTIDTQAVHAKKLRDELTQTEQAIASNADKKGKIDDELQRLEADKAQFSGKLQEVNALRLQVKEKELLLAILVQEKQKTYEKMRTEIDDSDEALMAVHRDNTRQCEQLGSKIAAKEVSIRELQLHVEENDREYQDNVKAIGKYEQQQAELSVKQSELAALTHKIIAQYHIEAAGTEGGAEVLAILQAALQAKQSQLKEHRAIGQKVDSGFEESIVNLKAKEIKVMEQFGFRRQSGAKAVARIKELVLKNKEIDGQVELDQHMTRTEELMELERKLNFNQLVGEAAEGDDDTKELMSEKQRALDAVQGELLVLHEERKKFSHQNDALTLIKHRQAQLITLINKHNAALTALLSGYDSADLPAILPMPANVPSLSLLNDKKYDSASLYTLLSAEHKTLKSQLKFKSDEHSAQVNLLSRLTGQLNLLKQELLSIDPRVERLKTQFASSEPDSPALHLTDYKDVAAYDEEMFALQTKLDKLTLEKNRNVNTLELLEKYKAKYAEEQHCPLCVRGFEATEDGNRFVQHLDGMIHSVRNELLGEKFERKAAGVRMPLKRLQELSPLFHEYVRLNVKERGEVKEKVDRLQREVDEVELKVEELERQVKKLTQRESRLSELLTGSAEVRRMHFEVSDSLKAVEKERAKISEGRKDGGRELEQVARELEESEKLRSRLQSEVSVLQERMNLAIKRRQFMTGRYHALKGQLAEVDKLLDDKQKNDAETARLKAQWQEDKDESDKLTQQHAQLKEALAKQEKEREDQRRKNSEGEAVLQSAVVELQRDVDAFSKLLDTLNSLTAEMTSSRSLHSQRDLYQKANQLKKLREDRDNGLNEVTKLKEQLIALQGELVDIDANIEHRKRVYEIEQQQKELAVLQQQLTKLTADNSALTQLAASEKRLERLHAKANEIKGALAQLQKYADERTKDLAGPLYRDVAQRYAAAMIDLQTNVMAVRDLETYARCLDVALMHYHTVKMREINEILRDYWRSIYRGHDIEEIHIKSAVETESGKRRNYSYSVMMKQGDIDLEMRGRCSAGQRVLASLLIRLALADTFCITAGFLALDEPTTNLDQKNISAFAEALAEIVEKRRAQSNFQLIVITHDEKFVEEMGRRAGADDYYRITKDPHTHYSHINRERWNQERED